MYLKRKLSSRKFWACAAGIVVGLAVVFGLDGETISTVAGAVTTVASVVVYILTEGKIDAATARPFDAEIDLDELVEMVKKAQEKVE